MPHDLATTVRADSERAPRPEDCSGHLTPANAGRPGGNAIEMGPETRRQSRRTPASVLPAEKRRDTTESSTRRPQSAVDRPRSGACNSNVACSALVAVYLTPYPQDHGDAGDRELSAATMQPEPTALNPVDDPAQGREPAVGDGEFAIDFEHPSAPSSVVKTLSSGMAWRSWRVPVGAEIAIIAALGAVVLALAMVEFSRTE